MWGVRNLNALGPYPQESTSGFQPEVYTLNAAVAYGN